MLQIMSDLHLEMRSKLSSKLEFPVEAKILALLGDIGKPFEKHYSDFIREQSERFETVLVIAGNHEFYGSDYDSAIYQMEYVCKSVPKKNVHFLNRGVFMVGNTKIIGTTLWSHITDESVEWIMNDYYLISKDGKQLTVKDTNEFYRKDVEFIKEEMEKSRLRKENVILLTHHAPYHKGTSDPKYEVEGRVINQAFATNLEELFVNPLKVACFGHTHHRCDFKVGNTRLVSNALGYPNELGNLSVVVI